VHEVRLGALDEVAHPVWRLHVPVEEQLQQPGQQERECGRRRVEAHHQIEDEQGAEAVDEGLHRVLVEGGEQLDALRAVVELVEPAPEEVALVAQPVPPVVDEGDHQVAHDRAAHDTQPLSLEEAVFPEPVPQALTEQEDADEAQGVEGDGPGPPPSAPGPAPRDELGLDSEHDNADEHGDGDGAHCVPFFSNCGGSGGLLLRGPPQSLLPKERRLGARVISRARHTGVRPTLLPGQASRRAQPTSSALPYPLAGNPMAVLDGAFGTLAVEPLAAMVASQPHGNGR
jgi:hypothetical protein